MPAVSVYAIGVCLTLRPSFGAFIQVSAAFAEQMIKIKFNNNQISLLTEKYSVCGISRVTLARQTPGVIVAVDAVALLPAVLRPIQQLLCIARGLAPTPFALERWRIRWSNLKELLVEK